MKYSNHKINTYHCRIKSKLSPDVKTCCIVMVIKTCGIGREIYTYISETEWKPQNTSMAN